jgi:hypothetical protein
MADHFMENFPHNIQNAQVPDEASNVISAPHDQSFAQPFDQGPNQEVEVAIDLPEGQGHSLTLQQVQEGTLQQVQEGTLQQTTAEHGSKSLDAQQVKPQMVELDFKGDK